MIDVAIASSRNRLYPGEKAVIYVRIRLARAARLRLAIELPKGFAVGEARAPAGIQTMPVTEVTDTRYLTWDLNQRMNAGDHTFELELEVSHSREPLDHRGGQWHVIAEGTATLSDGARHISRETVVIDVAPRARWLAHLPSIYRDDETISQFLMLFESFHAPLEARIDDIHHYLDPKLMPRDLLPWLAGWADLALDPRWPEARQRQLLRSAIALYRKRGTRAGLEEFLELYTGRKPEISERRSHNFVLGRTATLGPGVALGDGNEPHRFEVTLNLPRLFTPEEETVRRSVIETIIDAEKPAHTSYALTIEP